MKYFLAIILGVFEKNDFFLVGKIAEKAV